MFRKETGFTLIELLVAIALAAIVSALAFQLFSSYWYSSKKMISNQSDWDGVSIKILGIKNRLCQGEGLLFWSPDSIVFLKNNGQSQTIHLLDSNFLINDQFYFDTNAVHSISLGIEGAVFDPEVNINHSFDSNNDGKIDYDELDQDYSGDLDHKELLYSRLLNIHVSFGSPPRFIHTSCIIRNHVNPNSQIDDLND